MLKIAKLGRPVKYYEKDERFNWINNDYLNLISNNKIPVLFITGNKNKVFYDSNIVSYEYLNSANDGIHKLKIFEDYGHQDIFMGKNSSEDIFPHFEKFWSELK